ncbi:MAG: alpha-1,2-fucosyltransferase [Gloeocapsa sp. DLM2.Bin57]|nr:MAG: alpha-1,2-fucosyltransferase [Gloeocapsa sp. DLM2.Bin57]
MIIVRLTDGLGNQMFQYALGRKLSLLHSTSLKLDINWYKGVETFKQKRKYSLNCFNIQDNIATQADLDFFFKRNILSSLNSKTRKLLQLPPQKMIVNQTRFEFDPSLFSLPKNLYLKGYWQTEKYFQDIRDILLQEDFSFKTQPDPKIVEQINNSESVSLHIRRGDYVNEPDLNRIHGICSLEYYQNCVNYLQQYLNNPVFFIFSDDLDWVKANFYIPHKMIFVKSQPDFEDLQLMSLCNHNIIANSTFSWWGAWLNTNPDKIVCAPKQWFAVKSRDTSDLIPENWTKF